MNRILILIGAIAVTTFACNDDEPDALVCAAQSCSCGAAEDCEFSPDDCGPDSCSLDCAEQSVCSGSCGESCSVTCDANASCDVTVGKSGSVSCGADSVCSVTCTDSCSLSCGSGATCELQCAGDAEPQMVAEGGSCPG